MGNSLVGGGLVSGAVAKEPVAANLLLASIHPETFYATTDDGWHVAIHHWRARGTVRRHPIMMFHGLATNRFNFHPREDVSLVLAAANRGFDVFVVELRGAGLSREVVPDGAEPRQDWGFDDYVERDLPAAMEAIVARTGCSAIHALGHSMGGMVLYRAVVEKIVPICSLITLGTPLVHSLGLAMAEKQLFRASCRLISQKRLNWLPFRGLGAAASHLGVLGAWLADGRIVNGDNMDPELLTTMGQVAVDSIPGRLVLEINGWLDAPPGTPSPYAYEERLSDIDIPVLVIAGAVDKIAPTAAVRRAFLRLRSADCRFREMGRQWGDRADYGHLDLVVGRHAPEEVFPLVLDFLTMHD